MRVTPAPVRLSRLEVVRGIWGAAMLLAPSAVLTHVHGLPDDPVARRVARVLGARHLGQAVVSAASPTSALLAVGAWVDASHAASMYALAGVDPSRRRAGLVDGAVAGGFCLAGRRAAGRPAASAASAGLLGRRDRLAAALLPHLPLAGRFGSAVRPRP